MGSFGGKVWSNDTIKNQPVIFVHGLTLRAGVFIPHYYWFLNKGYSPGELYATTYADGGITPFWSKPMYCADVKQVRNFIKQVHEYTNSSVDVIGYSMGTAISRKALLGGKCVDTGEDLGPPLTDIVDTFIGVAGVARGYEQCPTTFPACNLINGMNCGSRYLEDVNGQDKKYEAQNSYYIYSMGDTVIGTQCCGHLCPEVKNADGFSQYRVHNHGSILTETKDIQYEMIVNHKVIQPRGAF
uniref:Triacylglycerol lipase n=1 Tax=Panagrolaimus davidi TaxID=227884 RepID=A0A914QD24_9BILA